MFCEKCGAKLQDGEKFCAVCGTPVTAGSASDGAQQSAGLQPAANMPNAVPAAAVETLPSGNGASTQSASGGKKPKKKLFITIGAVAAAVAVLGVVTFAFKLPSRISNQFHKTFDSPEKYTEYVVKDNTKKMADSAGSLYQSMVLDSVDMFETTSNSTVTLTFGEGFEDVFELVEDMLGEDMTWLKSISADSSITVNGNQLSVDLSSSLNKDKLMSLVMVLDIDEGAMYFQIPELSSTYLGVDLEDAMGRSYDEFVDQWEEFRDLYTGFIESLPDQKQLENLINKYVGIVMSCVDDANKKSVTLKVEGVSQKCTALEIEVTPELVIDVLEAILDEAESDKDLEDLIVGTVDALADVFGAGYYGLNGDDVYDEFLDGLDELRDELDEFADEARDMEYDTTILFTLYVDGTGDIIGRKLTVEDDYNSLEIAMMMAESGGKFGYEMSMYYDDGRYENNISFLGSGKKSGDKITGDFVLSVDSYDESMDLLEMTTESLDIKSLKEGRLNGKITVGLTPDSAYQIAREMGYSFMASTLEDVKLSISGKSSKNSSECTIGVVYGKKDMISVTVATENKKASSVKIPKSKDVIFVEDERDLEDWIDTINWKKFFSNLEKTDLPDFILDPLEDICDALEDGDWDEIVDIIDDLIGSSYDPYGYYDYSW